MANPKIYKLQSPSGLFWAGHAANFNKKGQTFKNVASLAYSLASSYRWYNAAANSDDLKNSKVVEYEIAATEVAEYTQTKFIVEHLLNIEMRDRYGYSFMKHYASIKKSHPDFMFAFKVKREDQESFIEAIRNFGHNSRSYKKTLEWIWVKSEDVAMAVKILGLHSEEVHLGELDKIKEEKIQAGGHYTSAKGWI